jgi:hypothetical protein
MLAAEKWQRVTYVLKPDSTLLMRPCVRVYEHELVQTCGPLVHVLLTTSGVTAWEHVLTPDAPRCDTSNDSSKGEEGSLTQYQHLVVLTCRIPTTTRKSQGIHRSLTRWPVARSRGVGMLKMEAFASGYLKLGELVGFTSYLIHSRKTAGILGGYVCARQPLKLATISLSCPVGAPHTSSPRHAAFGLAQHSPLATRAF